MFCFTFALFACSRCGDPRVGYEDAKLRLERGETKTAEAETQRLLSCYLSEKSEWHWRFISLKAEILHRQGSDSDALTLLKTELPPELGSTDLPIRRKLTQAMASAFTQQLPDADRYLAEAESLAEAGHEELLGEVALKRGTVAFFRGDLENAGVAYQKALNLARENNDKFLEAAALEGLGVVATKEEHYDEGIDWDRSALQLARSVGAQQSVAQTLGNMGWCYRMLGEYDNALTLYEQAEEASKQAGVTGDQIYWLTGIANVYSDQHDYAAAEPVLKQALAIARSHDDKDTVEVSLNDLAAIALETGRVELAESYQKEAAEVEKVNPNQSEELQSGLMRSCMEEKKGNHKSAEEGLRRVISNSQANSSQKWEAEARLAQVYVDESLNSKAEEEFRHSLNTIATARSSVQAEELRLSFLSTAISFYGEYIDFLISHGRVAEALQIAELSRARTLAEGLTAGTKAPSIAAQKFRPQEIAARSNAVVLFYWIGEKHSYVWAVTPNKLTYFQLPASAEIDPVVKAYRQAILEGRDVLGAGDENGKRLYASLVEPARGVIGKNSRVIVVPGEGLYGLNFETLIVPEPTPHFWIEDMTISTANSLALVSAGNQGHGDKQKSLKSLLLVGAPESPNPDFPPLAQGPAEVQKVSAHFAEVNREILLGRQATPAAYVAAGPEHFAFVHFVAHGTASHTRPLDSAVILSGNVDSYKLYAREIVAHPLRAQLVTISACNGAGTRAYAGEGLVGLAWAFLRAGARNVVASLWEVSDAASTTQLMDALYDGLGRGEDPATALRNAKLRILRSNSNTVFRKPFYWAPFQLYSVS